MRGVYGIYPTQEIFCYLSHNVTSKCSDQSAHPGSLSWAFTTGKHIMNIGESPYQKKTTRNHRKAVHSCIKWLYSYVISTTNRSSISWSNPMDPILDESFHKETPMGENFQDYSWIQDFEADFLWKVSLKMLNQGDYDILSD